MLKKPKCRSRSLNPMNVHQLHSDAIVPSSRKYAALARVEHAKRALASSPPYDNAIRGSYWDHGFDWPWPTAVYPPRWCNDVLEANYRLGKRVETLQTRLDACESASGNKKK